MSLDINIAESVGIADKLLIPVKAALKIASELKRKSGVHTALLVNVPDNLKVQDKMGTYKPWFNGMKHFYTVKSLPPKPKK